MKCLKPIAFAYKEVPIEEFYSFKEDQRWAN